jgi:hypothetical protein
MPAGVVWGQLRDFRSSARHDPFHHRITIEGETPRAGAAIEIEHRYFLFRTTRVGRILSWNERRGFSFSDFCRSDAQRAFPHVTSYLLDSINANSCQLTIRVGGRWTAPLPRFAGRIWLWWVFSQLAHNTENHLLRFAVATRHRAAEQARLPA